MTALGQAVRDANDEMFDLEDQSGVDDVIELYGDKEVRWYQIAARNAVEQILLKNPRARILVVLPTGAGKTITSGLIFSSPTVRKALKIKNRDLNLFFVAHKHRLLTQGEQAYADAEQVNFIPHSAFQDLPTNLQWDITCIDEAHHEAMSTIQYHLDNIGDKPIIGLTATPDRADNMLIKFDYIVDPISREQAVAEGWLAPTHLHTIVDVPSKQKIVMLTDIFKQYSHQMGQSMVFVRYKKEVDQLERLLRDMGHRAIGITNQTERVLDRTLNEFSNGDWKFVINCNKINEGVDVKGCTDVILGRQFGSYPQLNQVIGRASRPDSDCNVWELINPLSGRNLDTTVVVGTPETHRLISHERGDWVERQFDYTATHSRHLGMANAKIIH